MDSSDLLAIFRSEMRDEVEPYLWTDADIYRYMDASQKEFCRYAGGIADARSAITSITLVPGQAFYTYSPKIQLLRSITRASDGREIDVLNIEDIDPKRYSMSENTGPVRAVILGMDQSTLRCVSVPAEVDTLRLVVYRLPLNTIDDGGVELEIPEVYHPYLMQGMSAKAYLKQDAETFDRTTAAQHDKMFRELCDEAKHERERREHKPRTVQYGGL